MKTMKILSVMAIATALAVTGCKKDDVDTQPNGPDGRQFNVNMTDGPANYARLDVTIDGVEAYHDSQGWIVLSSSSRSVNVLSLSNGAQTSLATATDVETGHYSRLRIHFADQNSLTVRSAVQIGTLFIAAGSSTWMQWGGPADRYVEVAIDEDVSESEGAEVLIDFDAAASIREGLNVFVIDPSMREMTNVNTGARGSVTGTAGAAYITISNGIHTYTAYSNEQGSFMLRGMQGGTYNAVIWAPVRNESGQIEERRAARDGIVVTNGSFTNMGAIQF